MKIFVLLSRVPYPIEKGDKLRAFHHIRCLAQNNEVIVCALSDSPVHPGAIEVLNGFCTEVHIISIGKSGMIWNVLKAIFNGKPLQVGYFYRKSAQKQIEALIQKCNPDHIFCQLIRVSEYVKNIRIPKTLDYQDIFSTGAKRRAKKSSPLMKLLFMMEYRRLLRYENDIFDSFNHKTIISQPDRDLLLHPRREEVIIIPNGVDQIYFSPADKVKTQDVVFTGNMGYPPNIDAALFLANDIFPLVLKQIPEAKLLIAGANPHAKVMALKSTQITVSGWLPDIRDSYSSARIFIAPMRIGTGLQNKLLEAMAMKLPSITSDLANQALGAKQNEEILVGNNAKEFANHIINLLQNESFANTIAQNGNDFVKRSFNWENSALILEKLFNSDMIIEDSRL
jgi:sugar transferase (PEP-CTERM/EpsH1 system associated)